MNRNTGYDCTNTGRETITLNSCPLMKYKLDNIRKKLWKNFNTGWRKFLMMMKIAPGDEGVGDFVRNEGGQINETNLQSFFGIGFQYVLTQSDYMCPMK